MGAAGHLSETSMYFKTVEMSGHEQADIRLAGSNKRDQDGQIYDLGNESSDIRSVCAHASLQIKVQVAPAHADLETEQAFLLGGRAL